MKMRAAHDDFLNMLLHGDDGELLPTESCIPLTIKVRDGFPPKVKAMKTGDGTRLLLIEMESAAEPIGTQKLSPVVTFFEPKE